MNTNLVITIMAAGEGKRMNSDIPKVLHKVKETPMLIRIINEATKLNPKKIIIITGKYDSLIKSTIESYGDIYNKLIFIKQNNPKGTADAIKSTLEFYEDDEDVLILNGDMPLITSNLMSKFAKKFKEAKLLVAKLENPFGYGRIIYNEKGDFTSIIEEKDCSLEEKKIDIVNVGIYLFKSTILKKYIPMINNNNIQKEYYLTDIVKLLFNNVNIDTYLLEDNLKYQIYGVNTQEELHAINNF